MLPWLVERMNEARSGMLNAEDVEIEVMKKED